MNSCCSSTNDIVRVMMQEKVAGIVWIPLLEASNVIIKVVGVKELLMGVVLKWKKQYQYWCEEAWWNHYL